jgi:hypothetical protein
MMLSPSLRKLLSVGTGAGIEIGPRDLSVCVVAVRPNGVRVLAAQSVPAFRTRPAAEWGAEVAGILQRAGASHVAATVILPRAEVIVRQITLSGVADKEVPAALRYQVDSLHPYGEDEGIYDWSRLGSSPNLMVLIARPELVNQYAALFDEAGIRVASFSCSAGVLYSAGRMLRTPPEGGFLALIQHPDGEVEAYGESEARPLFSAAFDMPLERVRPYAASELRLPSDQPALGVSEILPTPIAVPEGAEVPALPYAAAISAACSWLALRANLLPAERRTTSSRLIYVPTVVLATILLLSVAALGIQGAWEDRRYLAALKAETAKLEPRVRQAATMDKRTQTARARTALLDAFRRRSRDDMDVLKETTHLLVPPTWLNSIEINRTTVNLGGETDQAAQLLKVLDASPLFESSDFTLGITRVGNMEAFRIRTNREAPRK